MELDRDEKRSFMEKLKRICDAQKSNWRYYDWIDEVLDSYLWRTSDGDKTKNTGNDVSVGYTSIGRDLVIKNSNGTVSVGETNMSGTSEALLGIGKQILKVVEDGMPTVDLSGISEAVLGIGKQILKVVEDGVHQFLTLISKLVSSSLGNRRLKRCINKIK